MSEIKNNNVKNKEEIKSSSNGAIVINRDIRVNGNMELPQGRILKLGDGTGESWSGLETKRVIGESIIHSLFGTGRSGTLGYSQIEWKDITNPSEINSKRLLFGHGTFSPEYGNSIDLGKETARWKNGYFNGEVLMGSDSTICSVNEKTILKFEDKDKTLIGRIGKTSAASKDFIVTPNTDGTVRLQNIGEGKAQLGTSGFGAEMYQGRGGWYFAPYGDTIFSLGRSVNRWGQLFTTASPNVSSDATIKDNIKYINNSESTLASTEDVSIKDMYNFVEKDLKLAEYTYINTQQPIDTIGFIAQDVEESNKKVADKFIRKDENGLLSYDMGAYISILAGALQEATKKIETLEARIATLETK